MRGKILVVDDEGGPRESLRQILKPDHDVRTADGGESALREVEHDTPDLVLLDLRMPGMDGSEVMKSIKDLHPDVEVAIITAYAGVDSARLAVRLGALDYLTKPYSVADVLAVVDKALMKRRAQRDAEVLASQLKQMTQALVHEGHALVGDPDNGVADAVNSLKSVQKQLDEDLGAVQELSKLGEATAEVTHDVSNLLTVILTSAQFLVAQSHRPPQADPGAVAERASRIVDAAKDCTDMISRIKDFVRISANQSSVPVDLNSVVSSVVSLKRDAPSATGAPVEFITRLKPVPVVLGDPVALRTMLVNLIENSLAALSENGTIELATCADDEGVVIEVKDNGAGMSAEVLASATQPFFTSKKAHGTGLGLSIVHKVAKRHHGDLSIESTEGEGATVTIRLPLQPPQDEPAPDDTEAEMQRDEAPQNGTVLLVEDEDAIRDLMATIIAAEGYDVVTAGDGNEGWEAFQRIQAREDSAPLVVVTDHEMPGILGRDLATRVKDADPAIPVVIVSAYISDREGPEDELLAKPFGLNELVNCVRKFMALSASSCPVS